MFIIRDYETGTVIEECGSYKEAEAIVASYEAEDKAEGNYTEDFYEICEKK